MHVPVSTQTTTPGPATERYGEFYGNRYPPRPPRSRSRSRAARTDATLRRALDLLVSAFALLLLLPALALIALLISLDSPGPVLFVQRRVGLHGKEFFVFKFRSMFRDAEARLDSVLAGNERSGPVFKMRQDPRITRAGRVLRRCSLDEVPQLLNVLRGEMSLVGPRPALPREVALYAPEHRARLTALPGLTGLWQVSGRASLSFEEAMALDLEYIARQSVGFNVSLLLRTVPAVLTGRGAY